MLLPLTYLGDPILRKKAARVETITPEIRQLAHDMEETLKHLNGVGLAAPQVKYGVALFVTHVPYRQSEEWTDGPIKVYLNPRIVDVFGDLWEYEEGCLSIPKLYLPIERPASVTLEAMTLEGTLLQETYHGLEARVFLHENDHLNGVLMFDRVHGPQRKKLDPILRDIQKKYSSN